MGLIESEAEAIAWVHQMAKTPTPGDHEVAEPHPYCLGDDPCCCVQLIAACETARADEREKAAGRVRVETLRELDKQLATAMELLDGDPAVIGLRKARRAIARLINAATTGDTDD